MAHQVWHFGLKDSVDPDGAGALAQAAAEFPDPDALIVVVPGDWADAVLSLIALMADQREDPDTSREASLVALDIRGLRGLHAS